MAKGNMFVMDLISNDLGGYCGGGPGIAPFSISPATFQLYYYLIRIFIQF